MSDLFDQMVEDMGGGDVVSEDETKQQPTDPTSLNDPTNDIPQDETEIPTTTTDTPLENVETPTEEPEQRGVLGQIQDTALDLSDSFLNTALRGTLTKTIEEGTSPTKEVLSTVAGGGLRAAEGIANTAKFLHDTKETADPFRLLFNSVLPEKYQQKIDPQHNPFSSDYEGAYFKLGSSQLANTPIGNASKEILGFGITLWATGGFKGVSALAPSIGAIRKGGFTLATGREVAKNIGKSGAARGAIADFMQAGGDGGTLGNAIRDAGGPEWATLTAINEGDNHLVKGFKHILEGAGLAEAADLLSPLFKARKATAEWMKGYKPGTLGDDEIYGHFVKEFSSFTNNYIPRKARWLKIAQQPENINYFTRGTRVIEKLDPEKIPLENFFKNKEEFTVNPLDGSSPTEGYMVAIDASKPLKDNKPETLEQFLSDHADEFSRDDVYIGGWWDDGVPYVELSRLVPDRDEAIRLGKAFDQKSVADIKAISNEDWDNAFIITDGSDLLKTTRHSAFKDLHQLTVPEQDFLHHKGRGPNPFNPKMGKANAKDNIEFVGRANLGDGNSINFTFTNTAGGWSPLKEFGAFLKGIPQYDIAWDVGTRTIKQLESGFKVKIGNKGKEVITNFNAMVRDNLKPGTFVTNEPVTDIAGKQFGNISDVQKRKIAKHKKLEEELFAEAKATYEADKAAKAWPEQSPFYETKWEQLLTSEKMGYIRELQNANRLKFDVTKLDEAAINVRSRLYGRLGFGETVDQLQYGVVRRSPDGVGRWIDPWTPKYGPDGKLLNGQELKDLLKYHETGLSKFQRDGIVRFGDIQEAAEAQKVVDAAKADSPWAPRGGGDGILTEAGHRKVANSKDSDRIIREVITSDPDLRAIAEKGGITVKELVDEAADLVKDFNGDVGKLPTFIDEDGRNLLSRPGIVAAKTLIYDTANQLSDMAYVIKEGIDNGLDMSKQVENLSNQLKSLLEIHKFTSYHYGLGMNMFKIPALGMEVVNPFKKVSKESVADAVAETRKVLDKLVKGLASGDPKTVAEANKLANAIMLADGDPTKLKVVGLWAGEIMSKDFFSILYNSWLSGPTTNIVNIGNNAFNVFYRHGAAHLSGSLLDRQGGQITRKMAAAAFTNFGETLRESMDVASRVWNNGGKAINDGGKGIIRASEATEKIKLINKAAERTGDRDQIWAAGMVNFLHDWATNPFLNLPTRTLTTADEFFKTMAGRMEWRARTMEQVAKMGDEALGTKAEFETYLAENAKKWFVTEGAYKGAIADDDLLKVAKDATMQTDLEGIALNFQTLVQSFPPLRLFFPFIKTGHNILAYGYSHLPLAAKWVPEVKNAIKSGDEYTIAMYKGRQAVGNMLIGSGFLYAAAGNITGNGPPDPEARKLWLLNNKPRSIQVAPGVWLDYSRLEPFNTILGAIGDVTYAMQNGEIRDKDVQYLVGYLSYVISMNLTQRSYFQGIEPLSKLLAPNTQGVAQLSKLPGEIVNSLIPASTLRRQFANLINPHMREFEGEFQRLLFYGSGGLYKAGSSPKYDFLTGEKIYSMSGGVHALWPFRVRLRKEDPVKDELEDIAYEASDIITTSGVELTPPQISAIQKWMGESDLSAKLQTLINSERYQKAKKEDYEKKRNGNRQGKRQFSSYRMIHEFISSYRDRAIDTLKASDEEFQAEQRKLEAEVNEARREPTIQTQNEDFNNFLREMP